MSPVPSITYSHTVRLALDGANAAGRIAGAVTAAGGELVELANKGRVRGASNYDVTFNAMDPVHAGSVVSALSRTDGFELISDLDRTMALHDGGKIDVVSRIEVTNSEDLAMAYTPGVARVCMTIHDAPEQAYNLTIKRNTVAVVSDGTAVLGLGDIGPSAAQPVMEGKALIFREFAGVNAFPICLDTKDVDEIVAAVKAIAPVFGGINLEDISAPRCFEIEDRLQAELDIPIFHDDQHGTAIVVLAALLNSLKVVGKDLKDVKIVFLGVGASGIAVAKLLMLAGARNIVSCDRAGALYKGRVENMNGMKEWFAEHTNTEGQQGTVTDVLKGADVFIGLSGPGLITPEDLQGMNRDAIVFAMANPTPEIMPEEAKPYVRIMATGRSDYPNQINNSCCFPGFFRGLLDSRAKTVTDEMKLNAAYALAAIVGEDEISDEYIIPNMFDPRVVPAVSAAVMRAAANITK
jgi:malate dehydrogenase (oxaloacetate-decarboxylating)